MSNKIKLTYLLNIFGKKKTCFVKTIGNIGGSVTI